MSVASGDLWQHGRAPATVVLNLSSAPFAEGFGTELFTGALAAAADGQAVDWAAADYGGPTAAHMALAAAQGPPPGFGPLFKCSYCHVELYESQLDYHVTVCPDPAEQEEAAIPAATVPPAAPAAKVGAAASAAPFAAPPVGSSGAGSSGPAGQAGLGRSSSGSAARSSSGGRLAAVRALPEGEVLQREVRSPAAEEQPRKDLATAENFRPKLSRSAQQTRTSSREGLGASRYSSQAWDQRTRSLRLKQVEAEAYADLTLRPKITRLAQAMSHRHEPGRPRASVFERLYSAAALRSTGSCGGEEPAGVADASPAEPSMPSAPGRSQATRKVPTSDLLYGDALDRRERLRLATERLHQEAEEVARRECQVLSRSRRYYWNMLERQTKAAFDSTVGERLFLQESQLEQFLAHFGCLRSSSLMLPSAGADEERRTMCAHLWRHLDPEGYGRTDLLTLTVFFHVLMGAVDDVAKASVDTGVSPPLSPQSHRRHAASASLGSPALAAIDEEEDARGPMPLPGDAPLSEAALLGESPVTAGSTDTGDVGDYESRRIVELLARFDPTSLRTEFRTLHLQRMYYQAQHERHAQPVPEEEVSAPQINAASRAMAAKAIERERENSEKPLQNHVDVMMYRYTQMEKKKAQLRVEAKTHEVKGCTFRPETLPVPRDMQIDQIKTPRGATRGQVLYTRAVAERERRDALAQEDAMARAYNEVRDCTFRPNTTASGRSFQKVQDTSTIPRGFYEAQKRLRRAGESGREVRQSLEDRMGRLGGSGNSTQSIASTCTSGASASRCVLHRGPRGDPLASAGGLPSSMSSDTLGGSLPTVLEEHRRLLGVSSARASAPSRAASSASPSRTSPRRPSPTVPLASPRSGATADARPVRSRSHGTVGVYGGHRTAVPHEALPSPRLRGQSQLVSPHAPPISPRSASSAAPSRAAGAAEEGLPPPVLYVDVNVVPGRPPERIVLREGQSVNEVAAAFAAEHRLTTALAQRLHGLLKEVLSRQEEHYQQQQQQLVQQ